MGSLKVRNLLLSKKLKRSETRILIIDDNQIRYNEIVDIFNGNNHLVNAVLLDDLKTFEKNLNTTWDLIIFGRAYDIKIEQAIALIQATAKNDIPLLLLASDDYSQEQYPSYIHKGVYDVLNLDSHEQFYITLVRALSFSRSLQIQQNLLDDLENAKIQTQVLAEEQKKAIASIQEGIHSEANDEYLSLFGLKSVDDLIGLPLLDIIQPKKVSDFKNRFKKVAQGQFEFGRFEVDTLNPEAKTKNPLRVEFIPSEEEDTIQITIETVAASASTSTQNAESAQKPSVLANIQRFLKNQPAKENALILFSLARLPDEILNSEWQIFKGFFEQLSEFVKEQTNSNNVFKVDAALYATVIQAESTEILNSRLSGLTALEKPQLIKIGEQTFQQNIRLGYSIFDAENVTEESFNALIEQAYNTRLPKNTSASDLELEATLEEAEITLAPIETTSIVEETITPSIIEQSAPDLSLDDVPTSEPIVEEAPAPVEPIAHQSLVLDVLSNALDKGEIQLKYQQFYDKQDLDLHIYEVTSGFIHENEWKKINKLVELSEDPELSSKIDRWILVEACKKLHNFITQYPDAKILVNLNAQSLVRDKHLTTLISKLITIVGSKLPNPLILQFDEEDFAKNMAESAKAVAALREHGAEISIRHFGSTISSDSILKDSEISYIKLDEQFTEMLNKDDALEELQAKIAHYQELRPVEMILANLDDMGSFANAWNVEPRFLQGDYFQKKLDHLTDVQDQ